MKKTSFRLTLSDNISWIQSRMGNSSDFVVRELSLPCGQRIGLFYLDGMVDIQLLQNDVIGALHHIPKSIEVTVQYIQDSVLNVGEIQLVDALDNSIESILSGGILLILEGAAGGLILSLPGWKERSVDESQSQPVVRGPRDSFTETLRTNTTLVRRRVKDAGMQVTMTKVGTVTKTEVAIAYMRHLADTELVEQIKDRLKHVPLDRVLESEYLEELLIGSNNWSIFPLIYSTDRPDTIAAGITEGKIAIFVDGTPFVLLAPALFMDFIQSAEDYYQPFIYSSLVRVMRYAALFICMLAPSVYIALTTFHQDMLPTQLLLSLAAQREGVPFPAFVEAILMEVTFEILREAGIRMPRAIGQAVSIVGTIVIGQAAVEASIVSAGMVIIVAITGIASFVIPSYAMSIPIRIVRFVFMGFAATFGSYGLLIGLLILLTHLCRLRSFGTPYMSPGAPSHRDVQSDSFLRFPYWHFGNPRRKRRRPT